MQAAGKSITFLLDLGATKSVLTLHSGPTVPSPISVTGVNGDIAMCENRHKIYSETHLKSFINKEKGEEEKKGEVHRPV